MYTESLMLAVIMPPVYTDRKVILPSATPMQESELVKSSRFLLLLSVFLVHKYPSDSLSTAAQQRNTVQGKMV